MAAQESSVDLILLGDLMLGRIVDEAFTADKAHVTEVWGDFLPYLQGRVSQAESHTPVLVAGNLECAVTNHEERWPKAFNFKLSPQNAEVLRAANLQYVSLANNHSLDFNLPGMHETTDVLRQMGIAYSGVGTAAEARAPAYVEAGGLRIAFLSYADHYNEWAATEHREGINFVDPHTFERSQLEADVRAARDGGAQLVCVFVHWGPNWRWVPSKDIMRLGHAFVEAGADIVFGHSSHHIQGIEVYQGAPIVYGAGGFIDDYALDEHFHNNLGFMYVARIRGGRITRLDMLPAHIHHTWLSRGSNPPYLSSVSRAQGLHKQWLVAMLARLSMPFGSQLHPLPAGDGVSVELPEKKA